jgi:hypothetical protein
MADETLSEREVGFNEGIATAMSYHRCKAETAAVALRKDGAITIENTIAIMYHHAMEADLGRLLKKTASEIEREIAAISRRST